MGISQQQALDCFASEDLIGIGMEADSVRRTLHPDGIVTYAVDHSLVLGGEVAQLHTQIEEAAAEGVATLHLKVSPERSLTLDQLAVTLIAIRTRFPSLYLQALSASQIVNFAATAALSQDEVLQRLRDAGLNALSPDVISPDVSDPDVSGHAAVDRNGRTSPENWLTLHRTAHRAGLRSQASLAFGGDLPIAAFVSRLFDLYALQQETAGFTSLTLHGFRPTNGRAEFEQPTAVEYLRTLAIARMVLDNFDHIEASCVDEGLKVMQMALRFGANDGGTIPATGTSSFTESDLRRVIRDAGFSPVERDPLYRMMLLNN